MFSTDEEPAPEQRAQAPQLEEQYFSKSSSSVQEPVALEPVALASAAQVQMQVQQIDTNGP